MESARHEGPPLSLGQRLALLGGTAIVLLADLREQLAHGLSTARAAYEAIFRALVAFGCARSELVFDGFQLGYAEPTAFIRAFKKWYRTTPGEYRKRNAPAG